MSHKRSEQERDSKTCGDDDVGIHEYGLCNTRQQLDGLWGVASEKVVCLPTSRIMTNDYKKDCSEGEGSGKHNSKHKKDKVSLIDEILDGGPPSLNISKPHRVF